MPPAISARWAEYRAATRLSLQDNFESSRIFSRAAEPGRIRVRAPLPFADENGPRWGRGGGMRRICLWRRATHASENGLRRMAPNDRSKRRARWGLNHATRLSNSLWHPTTAVAVEPVARISSRSVQHGWTRTLASSHWWLNGQPPVAHTHVPDCKRRLTVQIAIAVSFPIRLNGRHLHAAMIYGVFN